MAEPLRLRPALALAAASGLLFVPGFPPLGWWPCTLVAFAPLYVAIEGATPRRAFLLGWTSLMISSTLVFSWLVATVRDFGGLPTAAGVAVLLALSAYHGLRLGVATWLAVRAAARGWPAAPAFALAILTCELTFPLIFPWFIASAADSALPLLQSAELGGPLLVDLVLLAPSLALGECLRAWRGMRRPSVAVLTTGLLLPVCAAVWGNFRMEQVRERFPTAQEVRIGLVQPNTAIGEEPPLASLQASTRALAAQGAELVVWPEAAVRTSYNLITYPTTVPEQVTGTLGVPTLFGVRMWRLGDVEGAPRVRHNSAMLSGEDGSILGRYDKHKLLAFGEYTPFSDVFPALASLLSHAGQFTPGEGPQVLEWAGHRIAALICYEDILPAHVNAQVRAMDPDLLLNITNDAWFGDSAAPWIHLGEARLRSIEHRRFLVRSTNSGPSGVVDATGATTQMGALFKAEDRIVSARFLRARTLYERVGDTPWWVVAGLMWAAAFLHRCRRGG